MPREEDIVDQGEKLDFDPEFDNLFYSANVDDCLFDESEYRLMFSQIGDQEMWRDHPSNECLISFCGGMNRVWKEGKKEIEELKLNLHTLLRKEDDAEITREDIVDLFYGKDSRLYRVYHDQLSWSHPKFLRFLKTCGKMSEFNLTTTYAYSQAGMMTGMMGKAEFIACFEQIHKASSVRSHLTAAREDSPLWKECQQAFNIIVRRIAVVGRSYQVHLVDDDKEHFESVNRSVYEHTTIKKAKHVRDNHYGHVILPWQRVLYNLPLASSMKRMARRPTQHSTT